MAVEFDVKGSRTSEYRFLPEQIDVDPKLNGRHDLPDIQWIVGSILRHGQLQPVTIRRTAGKPVLVAGFSRWRAVSEINKKKLYEAKPIELRCSYTQLTEQQAFLANIEENRVRNATTPMDDAYNIQRLVNVYQMDAEAVAEAYRASTSWVKSRLKLIELTPEAEKAVRSGRVVGSAAKEIAKLSAEHQRNVLKAKPEGKITTADVKRESGEPAKQAPPDVKSLAKGLFKGIDEADLSNDSFEYISVDRKRLLKLYESIK